MKLHRVTFFCNLRTEPQMNAAFKSFAEDSIVIELSKFEQYTEVLCDDGCIGWVMSANIKSIHDEPV